jgi:hypothetical protein
MDIYWSILLHKSKKNCNNSYQILGDHFINVGHAALLVNLIVEMNIKNLFSAQNNNKLCKNENVRDATDDVIKK